mgnify:CR=1 FL=1
MKNTTCAGFDMSCAWPGGCKEGNMPGGRDYRTRDLGLAAPAWLGELLVCPVFPWDAVLLVSLSCFPPQPNGGLVASCYSQAHLILLLLLWGVIKEIKPLVRPLWGQRKEGRKIVASSVLHTV